MIDYLKSMDIIDFEKVRKFKKKDFLKTFNKYKSFLSYIGSPQNFYHTIIITGSTGKGTTAYIVSEILTAHKYKVGLYTSPHIKYPNERIKINNRNISTKKLNYYKNKVLKQIKNFNKVYKIFYQPTFFELFTIIAILYFKDSRVNYAVLEVGIGGKLDAVNVSNPILNFILPICREHTNFLGNSLKKILKEKQGIIRKNSITVTLLEDRKLLKILKRNCNKLNSSLFFINHDFKISLISISIRNNFINFFYQDEDDKYKFKLPVTSIDIIKNCGAVIFGLKKVVNINLKNTAKVLSRLKFSGRFEILPFKHHRVILDGAHNILAVKSFTMTIQKLKIKNIDLIFTIMMDKKAKMILKELSKISSSIILTRIGNPREYPLEKLIFFAKKYFKDVYLTENIADAFKNSSKKNIVLIGSFYLIGEFLKYVENKIK